MQIKAEQFIGHLKNGLAPVYLIAGDEPLLIQESADALRAAARAQGFVEREVLNVDKSFQWHSLLASSANLSLFADKKIIEIQMPNGKPGREGSDALATYLAAPPEDNLLLVLCGKLEAAAYKSKWVKVIDKSGVLLRHFAIKPGQMPQWLSQRSRQSKLKLSQEAIHFLAERVEGNLLAAAQELEKLCLQEIEGVIEVAQLERLIASSARYDLFDFVDRLIAGQANQIHKVLNGLQAEGMEPVLIVWAISRELRSLYAMAKLKESGQRQDAIFAKYRVWQHRKSMVGSALNRLTSREIAACLQACSRIDRMVKGLEKGNLWRALLQLSLRIAGVKVVHECSI